jgi:hypothetical protein
MGSVGSDPRSRAGRLPNLVWLFGLDRRVLRPLARGLLILVMLMWASVGVLQEPPVAAAPMPRQSASGPELEAMAARAASLLREHQTGDGFWLTLYTNGSSYEAPQQEMNTYLTSMLVDMLSPIAPQRGLDDLMERARQHLAAQIESNGLVRFHGAPDGIKVGGCVITPDADDTALVWRIASPGADDPRQQLMLGELARYRDAQGLYRTWLAPQQEFQCIGPSTPNLPDIGIQMHVYLMLRDLDPPAAQDLCAALQRSFWDEAIWIYYARSPLVPYLRSAELAQLDCPVPLPAERLARVAAGQEVWSEAARRLVDTQLVDTMASPPDPNAQQEIRDLLALIGTDDFAQLRNSPPLIYHQALGDVDLRADGRRFYWSDDFGYAVWLRLYEAIGVSKGQPQSPAP